MYLKKQVVPNGYICLLLLTKLGGGGQTVHLSHICISLLVLKSQTIPLELRRANSQDGGHERRSTSRNLFSSPCFCCSDWMLRVLRPSRRVYVIVAFVTDWMLIIETKTLVINQKKNTKKETNSRNYYILCYYILWRKVITFCITFLLHFVVKFITFWVSYYVLWRYTPAYSLMDLQKVPMKQNSFHVSAP